MITFLFWGILCSYLEIEVGVNMDILQIVMIIAIASDLNFLGHVWRK